MKLRFVGFCLEPPLCSLPGARQLLPALDDEREPPKIESMHEVGGELFLIAKVSQGAPPHLALMRLDADTGGFEEPQWIDMTPLAPEEAEEGQRFEHLMRKSMQ